MCFRVVHVEGAGAHPWPSRTLPTLHAAASCPSSAIGNDYEYAVPSRETLPHHHASHLRLPWRMADHPGNAVADGSVVIIDMGPGLDPTPDPPLERAFKIVVRPHRHDGNPRDPPAYDSMPRHLVAGGPHVSSREPRYFGHTNRIGQHRPATSWRSWYLRYTTRTSLQVFVNRPRHGIAPIHPRQVFVLHRDYTVHYKTLSSPAKVVGSSIKSSSNHPPDLPRSLNPTFHVAGGVEMPASRQDKTASSIQNTR